MLWTIWTIAAIRVANAGATTSLDEQDLEGISSDSDYEFDVMRPNANQLAAMYPDRPIQQPSADFLFRTDLDPNAVVYQNNVMPPDADEGPSTRAPRRSSITLPSVWSEVAAPRQQVMERERHMALSESRKTHPERPFDELFGSIELPKGEELADRYQEPARDMRSVTKHRYGLASDQIDLKRYFDRLIMRDNFEFVKERIFSNGCVERYMRTNEVLKDHEAFPFRSLKKSTLNDTKGYMDYLKTAEDLDSEFRYLYLGLFTLFEPDKNVALSFFNLDVEHLLTEFHYVKKNEWQDRLEQDSLIQQWVVAFYILGELSFPVNMPQTREKIELIVRDVFEDCSVVAPVLFLNAGWTIMKNLERMKDGNFFRDVRLGAEFLSMMVNRDFEMVIRYTHNKAKFIEINRDFSLESRSALLGGLLEIVGEEARETGLLAFTNLLRSAAGENLSSMNLNKAVKLMTKTVVSKYELSRLWPGLAFYGRLFFKLGDEILAEDIDEFGTSSMYHINKAWQSWETDPKDEITDKSKIHWWNDANKRKFSQEKYPGVLRD